MLRSYFVGLLLCVLTLPATAQVFWKISGNQLPQPSYLLGSMHIYDGRKITRQKTFQEALSQATLVVGELKATDMDLTPALLFSLMGELMMPGDSSLRQLVSAEEYQLINDYFVEHMGIGIAFFDRMRPIMLYFMASSLEESKQLQSQTISFEHVMDIYLQKIAEEKGKQTAGLETVNEQLHALLGAIPTPMQARLLLDFVRDAANRETNRKRTQQMVNLYQQQNLLAMERALREEMEQLQYRLLISDRNRRWLPKMEAIMQQQSALFVVGAGHLVGEDGLLALLRAEGYELAPIRLKLD